MTTARPLPIALLLAALGASGAAAQDMPGDVSASGNEPFWRVEIEGDTFTLMRPDFDPLFLSVIDRQTREDGTHVIVSASSSPALQAFLSLGAGPCNDTMADQTYPFTAELALGDTVLNGCGGDPRDLLTSTDLWTVTRIAGAAPVEGTEVTLGFDAEGRVAGSGGCNRFTGSYEITGEGMSFGPAASTRMACPAEIMAQEQAFFTALGQVISFDIGEAGELILRGPEGPVVRAVPRA